MEEWEIDFHWLQVRHFIKDSLQHPNLPDLQAVLMLIGIQELGRWKKTYSKEEKQDLMHIGTCEILAPSGYYEFTHRDQDGWPHYQRLKAIDVKGHIAQEILLKQKIIEYFHRWENFEVKLPVKP